MPPVHPARRFVVIALAVLVVAAGAGLAALWLRDRPPAQDLRVTFHIPLANPASPGVTYLLQNRGRQPADLLGVGLLEIADNPPIVNDSDNIDLCDRVDTASLKPLDQITPDGVMLGGSGQKRAEYAPVSVAVTGGIGATGAALTITAGQTVSIAASFKTDPKQVQGFSNQVFCPVLWLGRPGPGRDVAVCQGFAMATNKGGVSNTIVARPFRILPTKPGEACPAAGR